MRVQNIRFGDADWKLIQRRAADGNVSASDYIRVAAICRAIVDGAREDASTLAFDLLSETIAAAAKARGHKHEDILEGLTALRQLYLNHDDPQPDPAGTPAR